MANYIPAGANAVETSDLRTSGDVTVTDTQPGTVNNGEFLTNSGGNLTGGSIETEPNIPNWEETPASPYTDFNGNESFYISNIDNSYDYLRVFLKASPADTGGYEVRLELNGTEFHIYRYSGSSTFSTSTSLGRAGELSDKPFVAMMDFTTKKGNVFGAIPIAEKNVEVKDTDNIDSIKFYYYKGADFTVRIFGLNP